MKATITITFPSGEIAEGFPANLSKDTRPTSFIPETNELSDILFEIGLSVPNNPELHEGDKITIEITK